MSDKTLAHFVDATPSSGTPDTWSAKRDTRTVGSVTRASFICDPSGFLSIPHATTPKNLTAGESNADEGGGIYSFPCIGHNFTAGQTVEMYGTVNYASLAYEVQATSTANRVHLDFGWPVSLPFTPETYDGTETIVRRQTASSGSCSVASDTSGNIYLGIDYGVGGATTCVRKYAWDWTVQADAFFSPTGGWIDNGYAIAIALSPDEAYIYVDVYGTARNRIYKFNASTGAWQYTITPTGAGIGNFDMAVDSNDFVYFLESTGTTLTRHTGATGATETTYTGMLGANAICVNETLNVVVTGGNNTVDGGKNLFISPLDSVSVTSLFVHGAGAGKDIWSIFSDDVSIFCIGDPAADGTNVWKFNTALVLQDSMILAGARYGYIDLDGNIVIILYTTDATDDYHYYIYDTSFNLVAKYKVEGINGTNPLLAKGFAATYADVDGGFGGSTTYGTPTQGRTVAYPDGYGHLEKEELCVLADGAVHPKVTVSGGTYSLNYTPSVTHAGLCYDGHLKPMKIGGELYNKRIHHVEPNFYETIGGKIGESDSKMDTIQFRTGADPYDDSPDLFSGHKELAFDGSYNRQGDVQIEQESPLPMTVIGLGIKLDAEEL